jgi:AcrR family transcriptional regulator
MQSRGPYAKGREKRVEILDAVLAVLAEKGYRNTSLRSIADAVGIESASIIYYFGSRERLLETVIDSWDSRTRATIAEHVDPIMGWIQATRDNMRVPGLIQLYTAFAAESADAAHPSYVYIRDRYARIIANGTRYLELHAERGTLRPGVVPERAAMRIVALIEGLQLQWLIDPTIDAGSQLEDGIAEIVDLQRADLEPAE